MSKPEQYMEAGKASGPNALARLEFWLERNGKYVIIAGWAALAALYFSLASDELGGTFGGDNARYLMLARSLAEKGSYLDWFTPGSPPHTQYPFLFPLLLSPLVGTAHQVFYSHLMVLFIASLIPLLVLGFARLQGESRTRSLILFFLAASIPSWYSFLLSILTEPLFMFLMMLAIFILSHVRNRGCNLYMAIIFSLAVLASAMVREAGLILFIALLAAILLDPRLRRLRAAKMPLWFLLAVVFIAGYSLWFARNLTAGDGQQGIYLQQFLAKDPYLPSSGMMGPVDFLKRVFRNSMLHISHLGSFAIYRFTIFNARTTLLIQMAFFAVIIAGLAARMRRRNFIAELSFLAMFATAMVWNFLDERFSIPILPLAAYFFLQGIDATFRLFRSNIRVVTSVIGAALAVWQMGMVLWMCAKYNDKQEYPAGAVWVESYGPWDRPVLDASKYCEYWNYSKDFWEETSDNIVIYKIADEILPKGAVIASRKAPLAWFYTGRLVTGYLYDAPPEANWKEFKKYGVTHVIISPANDELMRMVKDNPECFSFLAIIRRDGISIAKIEEYPAE